MQYVIRVPSQYLERFEALSRVGRDNFGKALVRRLSDPAVDLETALTAEEAADRAEEERIDAERAAEARHGCECRCPGGGRACGRYAPNTTYCADCAVGDC